jgi:hypothetical protein
MQNLHQNFPHQIIIESYYSIVYKLNMCCHFRVIIKKERIKWQDRLSVKNIDNNPRPDLLSLSY